LLGTDTGGAGSGEKRQQYGGQYAFLEFHGLSSMAVLMG
jgi:hypothetical protein